MGGRRPILDPWTGVVDGSVGAVACSAGLWARRDRWSAQLFLSAPV